MALIVPFRRLASEFERAAKNSTWRALGNLVDRNFAEIERASRPHAARAYRTAAISVAGGPGVTTVIPMDTVDFDPEGLFDLATGKYVVPEDGSYQVSAEIITVLNNNPESTEVSIHRNGVQVVTGTGIPIVGGTAGWNFSNAASGTGMFVAGDLISVAVYHALGGNAIAVNVPLYSHNFLSVHKVG